MNRQAQQRLLIRLIENVIAIGLMFGGLPFVFSGDTYVAALWAIGAGILLSTLMILNRPYADHVHRKILVFAQVAFICWGFVIGTLVLAFIGGDLGSFSLWARASILIGPVGMIAASIVLFLTIQPQIK